MVGIKPFTSTFFEHQYIRVQTRFLFLAILKRKFQVTISTTYILWIDMKIQMSEDHVKQVHWPYKTDATRKRWHECIQHWWEEKRGLEAITFRVSPVNMRQTWLYSHLAWTDVRICSIGTERVNAQQKPISHKLYFVTHNIFIEFYMHQTGIIPFICLLLDMTCVTNLKHFRLN